MSGFVPICPQCMKSDRVANYFDGTYHPNVYYCERCIIRFNAGQGHQSLSASVFTVSGGSVSGRYIIFSSTEGGDQ